MNAQQNIRCCLRVGRLIVRTIPGKQIVASVVDISTSVNSGELCAPVSLDLSDAFNTNDLSILLEVVNKELPVEGGAMWLFESHRQVQQFLSVLA